MAKRSNKFGSINKPLILGGMAVVIILVIAVSMYVFSAPKFPIVYTADGVNTPAGYIWTDRDSSVLLANASTISDVSELWKSGQIKQQDGTTIGPEYKYFTVTVTDGGSLDNYGYYFLFGKELPESSRKYSNQDAVYGGSAWNGAVTYKAGRKPDSPFVLEKMLLDGDTWPGTTWAVYKLS